MIELWSIDWLIIGVVGGVVFAGIIYAIDRFTK